ncbi:MAG: AAA family ATPase, partial [Polyangia bacterium]
PENVLHPRLLEGLAEECRAASESSQLFVTTHSPFFLNGLQSSEVRVLYREADGYTHVVRASEVERVPILIEEGGRMGQLWLEGHLGVGDPLVRAGAPESRPRAGKLRR